MISRRLRAVRVTRLSDADRERALGTLKAHYVEGRLSAEEFERRVEEVYHAGTRPEAAIYLRELPLRGMRQIIVSGVRRIQRFLLRAHLFTYLTANTLLVGVWALTGHRGFWPGWLLVPTTVLLWWHAAASRALTRALGQRRW